MKYLLFILLFPICLFAQKNDFSLGQLEGNPQDAESICYSDGTDTLEGWKIHSYDIIEGYGFAIVDLEGNEVIGANQVDSKYCQPQDTTLICAKWSSLITVIDNTGTRFNASYDFEVTYTDGSTRIVSQTPQTGWTQQLNHWVTIFGATLPNAIVEPRCNILPSGCGGLLPPPTDIQGTIPLMKWRYMNITACPTDKTITKVEIVTSSIVSHLGKVLDLTYTATPEKRGWACKVKGQEVTLLNQDCTPVPTADIPVCWFVCSESFPPDPVAACLTDFEDSGCDNLGDEDQNNDISIFRRYVTCDGSDTSIEYYITDPNDASALIDYVLVGDFVDCESGEIIPEPECDKTVIAVEQKYDVIENSGGFSNTLFHDKATWLGGTGDATGSVSLANNLSSYPFDVYAYEFQSMTQVVLASPITISNQSEWIQFQLDVGFITGSGALATAANWMMPADQTLSISSIFPNSNSGYPATFETYEGKECVAIEEIKEQDCEGEETYRFVIEDGEGNLIDYDLQGELVNTCPEGIDNILTCLDSIKTLLQPIKKYNPSSDIECWQYGNVTYIKGQEFSEESNPFDKIYAFTDGNSNPVDTTGTGAIRCPDGTFSTTIECYVALSNGALYNQYDEIIITNTTNTATNTTASDTTINNINVNGNFGEDLNIVTDFENCSSWVDPRADLTTINNSVTSTNDILNLLLADALLNDLANGQDVCCALSPATGADIDVTKRVLFYENADVTVNYFDNLGNDITALVLARLAADPTALDCCPSPEVSSCLFCDDNFNPTPDANTGRMYKRTVNATQWQVYSWQLSRIRTYINSIGGTITSEKIGYYSNAAYSVPLAASRIQGGVNPKSNATGPLTDGQLYINYNTASYLNRTTEPIVYFEQAITYEFDGCTYEVVNRHQYDVPATNTGWIFEAGTYDCTEQ